MIVLAAVHAAIAGKTRVMLGWRPDDDGGVPSPVDPRVELFDLDHVITQTKKLLEGSHSMTQARMEMIRQVQGVLPL